MNTDFTEMVIAAQNGDQRAFEALYDLTKDSSYFVAFSITHNEEDALDIMQDSYLKVFNNIKQLNDPTAFEGWLNRIVANTAKNYIAKKKPILFDDIGTFSDDAFDETELNKDYLPEQAADSKETSRLLMEIINNLSEEKRLCILMYYYQEMSVGEIAEALQLPISTVKYKLLAARADIKKEVEKLEKDGTKLYTIFPFTLFSAQFNHLEKEFTAIHTAPAYSAVYKGTAVSAAGTIAAANTGFFTTLAGKAVIAVTAILLIGGGITAAIVAATVNSQPTVTQNIDPTDTNSSTVRSDDNTELLTTEQVIEKMKAVGTDEATFALDGVIYTLPCPLKEFRNNGWISADGETDAFETKMLWQNAEQDLWLKRSDGEHSDCIFHIRIKNTSEERISLNDCNVEFFDMDIHILSPEQDYPELVLSGGLSFDNMVTKEAVTGTCGPPDSQQDIYYSSTALPDIDTKYNLIEYPTMSLCINSEPEDADKYNYHMCRIFPQQGE